MGKETFGVGPLLGIAMLAVAFPADVRAQQNPVQQVAAPVIDDDDIGGVVTSRFGPEAGVWVIAETKDLGTRFAKIVVTDERGRYVIPDLPKANYRLWVRGYGLVDSEKVAAQPGSHLDMTAVIAPRLAEAAQYYPAAYWYSMLKIPDQSRFPGTGDKGNGIPEYFKTPQHWLNFIKTNGCGNCHQIGNYATRTIPAALGQFESSIDAWSHRLSVGPAGHDMVNFITQLMTPDGGQLKALADWTDRIQAGELPSRSPQRPVGVERNLVVTVRDWLDPKHYLHDLTATDRRHPRINAYGPIYGDTELSSNAQPVLDPVHNIKTTILPPVREGTPSSLHSAQLYPLDVPHEGFFQNSRQVTVYDPKINKFTTIDTCFGTHHLNFAEDANNTLWLSNNTGLGGAPAPELAVAGWINTKLFWQTGDAAKAQGWTPFIVDTNGNGKRDEGYNQPGQPPDYSKDTRLPFGMYAMAYSPADKVIWSSSLAHPGYIMRLDPGPNPPDTALTEIYKVPMPGYGIRGMDVDRNGVAWLPLDSGHLASFDRRKCKGPLNGPGAEKGEKCPEGFTFYPLSGPGFQGDPGAEENPYYVWVDWFNILGLGSNVPFETGNQSDSLHALVGGQIVELRVPYPMGFFTKGLEGRIDDPKAGWKGRALWATSGNRAPFHIEAIDAPAPGAPGATPATRSSPLVVEFQLRPDPLAH